MNDFVYIYTKIWNDKKFKKLGEERLLFLYLLTNQNINLSGIYELDMEIFIAKMKMGDRFDKLFKQLINSEMIKFDDEFEIVWIINRFRYIHPKSPKIIVGAIEELNQISHKFKDDFIKRYSNILSPFLFKLDGYRIRKEEFQTEEFIINAAKIHNSKSSLKRFIETKVNIGSEKIDAIINRILPDLKQ